MTTGTFKEYVQQAQNSDNNLTKIQLTESASFHVYPASLQEWRENVLCLVNNDYTRMLIIVSKPGADSLFEKFEGEVLPELQFDGGEGVKLCPISNSNAAVMQQYFPWLNPVVIGTDDSFGFGDRLGLANPGHLRSLEGSHFKPVLSQQSIRELTRTKRQPEDVMAAAVWAAFQEGWKEGFGADADHLKTEEDIDRMLGAGFTMYTIDPSDYVVNEADGLNEQVLLQRCAELPWGKLESSFEKMESDYLNQAFSFGELELKAEKLDLLRALLKYGGAVAHIKALYDYLVKQAGEGAFEVEVSVDETDSVTTPFEHFFIAKELNRLEVKLVSLAPRFIGDFEKGIDYKGDIELFKQEYKKHVQIASNYGGYKISLHSGSDKFTVYEAIGDLKICNTHVKTAGTSYLEALRTVAASEPDLFREILDYAAGLYEEAKKTYHVSADLNTIKRGSDYGDDELTGLFEVNDPRQVLHVTFGQILNDKNESGQYLFRERFFDCLRKNEDLYNQYLKKHFQRHLKPFASVA